MLEYVEELENFLEGEIREGLNVVVMPDFFLDRLITLPWNVEITYENVKGVAERKGGSIDGIAQTDIRGGNSVNVANALAMLGVKVTPIICTDKFGFHLLKFYVKSKLVDFSHVKIMEKPSITTAMEFKIGDGRVNVMLRDVGSLADFGPQHLSDKEFSVIESADYVCLFNWAGTRNFGTELAETVFRHVKTMGKGKTYYDTADPYPNREKIPWLVKKVLMGKHIDILGANENEAVCYASQISEKVEKLRKSLRFDELAMESARILASQLSARIDLHTTEFSATFTKNGETVVPAFKVPVLRATGAGDAWTAGNILGDAHSLSDACRLALANAVAAYYISNPYGLHPTRKQLMKFCKGLKAKAKT
ncbi:MAG: carbohydrate kinase family protein [Candidatus Bathyarchaeia archaeon]